MPARTPPGGAPRLTQHRWVVPAIFSLLALAGGLTSNLVASDLGSSLGPYRAVVWAVFGLSIVAAIVAAVKDSLRPQPPPLIPIPSQLPNLRSVKFDTQGNVTYSVEEGGQIIGRITESIVRRSERTVDPTWEHAISGKILNFSGRQIVIRRMNVVSDIDNEVMEHYVWRAPDPLQIIAPGAQVEFSLVFWPLGTRLAPGYRFHLVYCLMKVLTETTSGSLEIPVRSYRVNDPRKVVEAGLLSEDDMQIAHWTDMEVRYSVRTQATAGFGWKVRFAITKGDHPLPGATIQYVVIEARRHCVTYEATTDEAGEVTHLDYATVDRPILDVVLIRAGKRLLWIRKRCCVISKETPVGRIEARV